MKKLTQKYKEHLIYIFFWGMVFIIPLLMMYARTQSHTDEFFDWDEILHIWGIELLFFVVFIVHNIFIAPLIVYKHKRNLYLAITGVIVIAYGVYKFTTRRDRPKISHQNRTEIVAKQNSETPPPGPHRRPFFVDQFDFISVIVLILMLGMNVGIKLLFKQDEDEKKLQALKNENLNQQLEYLKYQINPHFFMNTLNNIHALVDIDPEEAKESIIELSKLMRYVLYEGSKSMTTVAKENNFIDNYIKLMRLRYSDKVEISVDKDDEPTDALIAPLITITYIENAFKHGVSYREKSFIHITAHVVDNRLSFKCVNSKHKESTEDHGGVGLENTRKRLNLIYGDDYKLDIDDGEETYTVVLDIPLKKNTL